MYTHISTVITIVRGKFTVGCLCVVRGKILSSLGYPIKIFNDKLFLWSKLCSLTLCIVILYFVQP